MGGRGGENSRQGRHERRRVATQVVARLQRVEQDRAVPATDEDGTVIIDDVRFYDVQVNSRAPRDLSLGSTSLDQGTLVENVDREGCIYIRRTV